MHAMLLERVYHLVLTLLNLHCSLSMIVSVRQPVLCKRKPKTSRYRSQSGEIYMEKQLIKEICMVPGHCLKFSAICWPSPL